MVTELSATVLEVFRRALDLDELSMDNDFFDVGGYSLLIIRIISTLREEHGIQLIARQFAEDARIGAIVSSCRPIEKG
jgi:hypothetical protein